jgi:hypothetical protein
VSPIKCNYCKKNIKKGSEERKHIQIRKQGEVLRVFGEGAPDGPISAAAGQLIAAYHGKEYWIQVKLVRRGGTRLGGEVSAYAQGDDWRPQTVADIEELL